jgi:hypothetical protein
MIPWDPSIPEVTEWVAVLGVGSKAEDLDRDAAAVLRRAPDHGLFGRVDAHEGLAEHLAVPSGTWISGVAAPTRTELERVPSDASEGTDTQPLLVGEFRVRRLARVRRALQTPVLP